MSGDVSGIVRTALHSPSTVRPIHMHGWEHSRPLEDGIPRKWQVARIRQPRIERRRSGRLVTASDFGSNGPRIESGRGRCVESLDKAPVLLPLSQGEAFTLASISYLAILVKYILAKKKKKPFLQPSPTRPSTVPALVLWVINQHQLIAERSQQAKVTYTDLDSESDSDSDLFI